MMKKKKVLTYALLGLLAVQLILIIISNFTLTDRQIDSDSAKLMVHVIKMWEEKTIFVPDWSYLTTLEFDCTALFAVLFYGLTGNIYVACALSNALLMLVFLTAVFLLFRDKAPLYPLLCANLICIPYRLGMLDYYNMLFFAGTQYIVKVTMPILLIALLLRMERNEKIPKVFFGIYYFYLFLTSMSSGVYVPVCCLAVIFLTYAADKFFRWERVPGKVALLGGISAVISLAGILINYRVMGGALGNGMVLCSIWFIRANVESCFYGLFELLGGLMPDVETKVLSVTGILLLVKLALTALLLSCGAVALVKCLKRQGDLRMLLLSAQAVLNFIILCVTGSNVGSPTYDYRYHLMGMIPLFCLTVLMVLDYLERLNPSQQVILFSGGLAAMLFLQVISFSNMFRVDEMNGELKELCAFFEENPEEIIYIRESPNAADICRLLDISNEYIYLNEEGTTLVFDYYEKYKEAPMEPAGAVVVTVGDCGADLEIGGYPFVRRGQVGNRYLYQWAVSR